MTYIYNMDKIYRINEFAKRIGRSTRTLRRWDESGKLKAKENGCEIVVVNQESLSPQQEMVEDLMAIIHTFSCRLYGLRKYKKEIKKIIAQS